MKTEFEQGFFEELKKIASAGSTTRVERDPEILEDDPPGHHHEVKHFSRTGSPGPEPPEKWTPGTYSGGSVIGKLRSGFKPQ